MIYPKKKPKAGFGLDLSQVNMKEGITKNAGSISGITSMASDGIKKVGTNDLGYGVSHTGAAANIYGGYLKGMGKGAEIGSAFGPKGALIGASIGATAGLVTGVVGSINNTREDALRGRDALEMQAVSKNNTKGNVQYNTLEQKNLMAQDGVKLPDTKMEAPVNDKAVILGGKRHKQGGNDIVDETGEKVAETEREEIIFTKDQTDMIDRSVKIIDAGDESEYLNLGSYIKELIQNRTEDQSGKFKKIKDADIS